MASMNVDRGDSSTSPLLFLENTCLCNRDSVKHPNFSGLIYPKPSKHPKHDESQGKFEWLLIVPCSYLLELINWSSKVMLLQEVKLV